MSTPRAREGREGDLTEPVAFARRPPVQLPPARFGAIRTVRDGHQEIHLCGSRGSPRNTTAMERGHIRDNPTDRCSSIAGAIPRPAARVVGAAPTPCFRASKPTTVHQRALIRSGADAWGRLHRRAREQLVDRGLAELSRAILDSAHLRVKGGAGFANPSPVAPAPLRALALVKSFTAPADGEVASGMARIMARYGGWVRAAEAENTLTETLPTLSLRGRDDWSGQVDEVDEARRGRGPNSRHLETPSPCRSRRGGWRRSGRSAGSSRRERRTPCVWPRRRQRRGLVRRR